MIVRVAQRAAQSTARRVVVAADDAQVVQACQAHSIEALLTRQDHVSGSDRLAEACALLGLADDDERVNAWGGAIALGHPLGASGARLATTAVNRLHATGGRYALCTMCIGVGQGIALILERV